MSCSREYSFYRYYNAAKTMNITYERDGQKYTTQLTPQYTKLSSYKIEPDCTIQSVTKIPRQKRAVCRQRTLFFP